MKTSYTIAIVLLLIFACTTFGQEKSIPKAVVGQDKTIIKKQEIKADPRLILSVSPKKIKVKVGKTVAIKLHIKIPKKWHIYGIELQENKDGIGPQATEITLKDSTPTFRLGTIKSPKTKVEYDEGFEMDVKTIEGDVTIELPLMVSPDATPGKYKSTIAIYFQMCDGKTCLTPHEETVPFEVEIAR